MVALFTRLLGGGMACPLADGITMISASAHGSYAIDHLPPGCPAASYGLCPSRLPKLASGRC